MLGLISEGTATNPPGGPGTRKLMKKMQNRVAELDKNSTLSGLHVIKWNSDTEKFEIWKADVMKYYPSTPSEGCGVIRGDGTCVLPNDPDYAGIRAADGTFEEYFYKVEEHSLGAWNKFENWLSDADESAHSGAIKNFAEEYYGPTIMSLQPIVAAYETFTGNDIYGGKLSAGERTIGILLSIVPGGKASKKLVGKKLAKTLKKFDKPVLNTAKAGGEITQRGLHFNVGDVHVETIVNDLGQLTFQTKGGSVEEAADALKSVTTWLHDPTFREKTMHVLDDFINDSDLIKSKTDLEKIKNLLIETYGN